VRLSYALVAEAFALDRFTNRMSIFNIIDQFQVHSDPTIEAVSLPHLCVILQWRVDPEDHDQDFQVKLIATQPGMERKEQFINFKGRKDSRTHRILHMFTDLRITKVGDLQIEVQLNGREEDNLVIPIEQAFSIPPRGGFFTTH